MKFKIIIPFIFFSVFCFAQKKKIDTAILTSGNNSWEIPAYHSMKFQDLIVYGNDHVELGGCMPNSLLVCVYRDLKMTIDTTWKIYPDIPIDKNDFELQGYLDTTNFKTFFIKQKNPNKK